MKKATFHEDADAEMIEAARYYEERSSGLGEILENPQASSLLGDDVGGSS